ncbi:MAG: FeoA family protein [Candidatus Electrothrix sp. YB6]
MRKKRNILSRCLGRTKRCGRLPVAEVRPLSECCGCSRVRVCRISGDRNACGRMACLGILPGTEVELLCPMRGRRGRRRQQCMVRINGGVLSLDGMTARNILVQPV